MTTQEAIKFFGGTQTALAKALGIGQSSVAEWGHFPPPYRQLQLERLSKNRLRAEKNVLAVGNR